MIFKKKKTTQDTTHSFSKKIVVYCVIVSTVITLVTLGICWRSCDISSGVLTALLGLWGGELLLLCVKRILTGKNDICKDEKDNKEDERDDSTPTI